MKLFIVLIILLSCVAGHAQSTQGYFFVAPGGISVRGATSSAYEVGGGVERLFGKGIGAGADLSGLIPGSGARDSVGLLSLNGYYHPLREQKLDPFVTAGYSLMFRGSTANLFNFGGGARYWLHDNLGCLVEFRDHLRHAGGVSIHYWGIRLGLTFR